METQNLNIEIDPAKLKAARGGRSPSETARQLGISYQYLHMIEAGKRDVPSEVLVKMCKLYGIEKIFDITKEPENILAAA
ncbi:MAG: helix-turn-helix transcriptional regulator [Acidobacteria bacterium]|nr:helix-turn-helix transcriptional regulator [Acidobacteriota bacterium]